jgi:hypothetical protein
MVPFVGIFFAFTNTVGAALWAADIEGAKTEPSEPTAVADNTAPAGRKKEL